MPGGYEGRSVGDVDGVASAIDVSPETSYQVPARDDVAPPDVILDAMTYYNAMIAPDLAADGSSYHYTIEISKWADFNASKRHLSLCLVTLHRATLGQAGPDRELFEDVSLFFFSQIQASAYGAWRAHLDAAKTLFNMWGVEAMIGHTDYEFYLCHLVLADVFGTAMAPASYISADDISQHEIYLNLLGRFTVDVCSTMVPIPEAVVRATAATNILRAAKPAPDPHGKGTEQDFALSRSTIYEALRRFDPTDWALHRPRHTSSQATSWSLLATCFKSAALLYLARSSGTDMSVADESSIDDDGDDLSYSRLICAVHDLYNLKQHGGVLHKYILWPMVISGVEAVARNDEPHLKSLCELLEQTTIDLGTLSMREAAVFLEGLWTSENQRSIETRKKLKMDWDTVFDRAPLFLM
ncbi:hypothetical protein OPT61_g5740 [Boeremia exigua]|uniref:Uncharacterized protein n=1 Tax=Boeremia exigua TaxID=749465 RepID=A0ACC2I9C5_9PLEO|nr:hypothetical protein OPT61_g5740 [Boeremia exigua]